MHLPVPRHHRRAADRGIVRLFADCKKVDLARIPAYISEMLLLGSRFTVGADRGAQPRDVVAHTADAGLEEHVGTEDALTVRLQGVVLEQDGRDMSGVAVAGAEAWSRGPGIHSLADIELVDGEDQGAGDVAHLAEH